MMNVISCLTAVVLILLGLSWTTVAAGDIPAEQPAVLPGGDGEVDVQASPEQCCVDYRGNANGDVLDAIGVEDIVFLIYYLFRNGPEPPCREEGNADGDPDETINILDVTYLLKYKFGLGPQPPACP